MLSYISTATVRIRLKGPLSKNGTGRVEMFLSKKWGVACYSHLNFAAVMVICRQLGFPGAFGKLFLERFAEGPGPFYELRCSEEDEDISTCYDKSINDDCYVAGVACRRTGKHTK